MRVQIEVAVKAPFLRSPSIVVIIPNTEVTAAPVLSVQFCGTKYIHVVVQPSPPFMTKPFYLLRL